MMLSFLQTLKAPAPGQTHSLLIRLVSACVVFSLFLSWNLWFQAHRIFLPSPILPFWPVTPKIFDLFFILFNIAVSLWLVCFPRYRKLCLIFPVSFLFWILGDEFRWQPFLYMYAFILLVLGATKAADDDKSLNPLRYMVIGIYFWAGFHKLNAFFAFRVFPWFVDTWLPPELAPYIGFFVPGIELSIALLLLVPALRNYGVALAAVMLAVVIGSLAFGHDWGVIVWPWNVMLFSLVFLLFFNNKTELRDKNIVKEKLSFLAVVLFMALPAASVFDLWGAHPSFKLYCGCTPMATATFDPKENFAKFPPSVAALAQKDHTLDATALTITLFRIAATAATPGDGMYAKSLAGLCPYLDYPQNAQLKIYTPESLMSANVRTSTSPLCPAQ